MGKVLTLLLLILAIALLKSVLLALAVALLLALVCTFAARPRETIFFLTVLTLFGLASVRPTAFIIAGAVVGVAALVSGPRRKAVRPLLLTDVREER